MAGIEIFDGIGAGLGKSMCSIDAFHFADVREKGYKTELWIEGRSCITVGGGIDAVPEKKPNLDGPKK